MNIKFLVLLFTATFLHGDELAIVSQDPDKGKFWCSAGGEIADFENLDLALAFLKTQETKKVYMRSKGFTSKTEMLRVIEKISEEGLWLDRYTIPVKITIHIELPYRSSSSTDAVSVVSENEINQENLEKAHEAYLKQRLKERVSREKSELTSRSSQFLSRSALQS